MRTPQFRIAILLFVFLTGLHSQMLAAELQFGSLRVDWLEAFTTVSDKPPFELSGPAGEKVLVTVMRPGKQIESESASGEQSEMAEVGERLIAQQGSKAGKMSVPLSRSSLKDGSVLLFAGSETLSRGAPGFFLQYLVVSPTGRLGFVTIEGKGSPIENHMKFFPAVQTATWLP